MNSDKRMAELYLERDAGKKHTYADGNDKSGSDFSSCVEYKLKPETLEEAICQTIRGNQGTSTRYCMKLIAQWAWANPESKE